MLVAAAGLLLVVIGVALALVVPRGSSHPVALSGAAIAGQPPAPDFALRDQDGARVRLSSLRGKVVLVTFLYVHCPDVCPLIASRLNEALPLLGRDARVLAVSVDPRGDTPAAVRTYVHQRGLGPRFRYLIGSRAELAPVWKGYFVGAQAAGAEVLHSSMTVLVDDRGRERVRYDASATPAQIAHDVRALGL
jgi:protein SCO1/2